MSESVNERMSEGKKSRKSKRPVHTCAHCGHTWQELTAKDAKLVIRAAQVNGRGPWCNLCHHLKFALIFAANRGHSCEGQLKQILLQTKA